MDKCIYMAVDIQYGCRYMDLNIGMDADISMNG